MNQPGLTSEERSKLKQQELNLLANIRHYREMHDSTMRGPDTIQAEKDGNQYWKALTKAEQELREVSKRLYGH